MSEDVKVVLSVVLLISAIDRLIKMYGILRSHGLLKFLFANGEVIPIEEFKRIINGK